MKRKDVAVKRGLKEAWSKGREPMNKTRYEACGVERVDRGERGDRSPYAD